MKILNQLVRIMNINKQISDNHENERININNEETTIDNEIISQGVYEDTSENEFNRDEGIIVDDASI